MLSHLLFHFKTPAVGIAFALLHLILSAAPVTSPVWALRFSTPLLPAKWPSRLAVCVVGSHQSCFFYLINLLIACAPIGFHFVAFRLPLFTVWFKHKCARSRKLASLVAAVIGNRISSIHYWILYSMQFISFTLLHFIISLRESTKCWWRPLGVSCISSAGYCIANGEKY